MPGRDHHSLHDIIIREEEGPPDARGLVAPTSFLPVTTTPLPSHTVATTGPLHITSEDQHAVQRYSRITAVAGTQTIVSPDP